ncbi:hypothetical protein ACWDYH_36550 [Nocardia goodfellowii]
MVFWFVLASAVKWALDRYGPDSWPRPWVDLGIIAIVLVVVVVVGAHRAHRAARRRAERIQRSLDSGAYSAAIPLMRTMLQECEDMEGPGGIHALYWRHQLAETLGRTGETVEALAHASIALRGREAALGPHHARTQASRRLYERLLRQETVDPLIDMLGTLLREDTGANPDA